MSMQYLCIQICMHSAALAQIADGRFGSTYGGARLAAASARGAEFVYGFLSAWGTAGDLEGCQG